MAKNAKNKHGECVEIEKFDEVDFPPNNYEYYIRDLVICSFGCIGFIWDWVSDMLAAFNYYVHGDINWFRMTMVFVLFPSLAMMIISFYWYVTDADKKFVSKPRWAVRILLLLLQMGPIVRYMEGMYYGMKSRKAWKRGDRKEQMINYRLMLKEDADAALCHLVQCFLESAPQLIIQLYILLDVTSVSASNRQNYLGMWSYLLWISCGSSLVSLSWGVTSFTRANRYLDNDKLNISLCGTALIFLWQLLVIGSRVLSVVLFSMTFTFWVFVAGALHWAAMFLWVLSRRAIKSAFPNCFFCEAVISMILAGVYNFAYINDKEEATRVKYGLYHLVCYVEIIAMVVLWSQCGNPHLWYYIPGIILPLVCYLVGLCIMATYYSFHHPSRLPLCSTETNDEASDDDNQV